MIKQGYAVLNENFDSVSKIVLLNHWCLTLPFGNKKELKYWFKTCYLKIDRFCYTIHKNQFVMIKLEKIQNNSIMFSSCSVGPLK